MKRRELTQDDYRACVEIGVELTEQVEQTTGELDDVQKYTVLVRFMKGFTELLVRFGPPMQSHAKNLRRAYEQICREAQADMVSSDHPPELQLPELGPLEEEEGRSGPVEGGGAGDPTGPVQPAPADPAAEGPPNDQGLPKGGAGPG